MSMPHPSEIALYWSREDPEICLDPGEPSCFACGFWREKVFELDYAQLKRRVSSAARSIGAGLHSGISSHATRALIIKQVHDDLQVDAGTARHSCGK
jgi:hypothetical protein